MDIWLMLILMLLWMPMSALCVFAGIWLGKSKRRTTEPIMTAEDKRRAEREKRELDNFWSYTGDENPK